MIWILFIATLGLSLWASWRVRATYNRYNQGATLSGLTGREAAARILAYSGIRDVEIVCQEGRLSDHYDPLHKRLVLSEENFLGQSPAALGVAAHEAGHAIQHQKAYAPLHWRMAAVGATNIASQVVMWLPLIGMFTGLIQTHTGLLIMAVAWGVIMLFNLVTLPVEFDATRRAKLALAGMGMTVTQDEKHAVDKVLGAAAFTYVAAFITSLVYFLWHLLPLLTGRSEE
jgi:hypothetical protein